MRKLVCIFALALGSALMAQTTPQYVPRSGATMTGPLVLSGLPTASGQAANMQYVQCAKDQANGLFNVVCYGAVPGGTTDDTTAFQNAVNAAAAVGGEVIVPAGQWLVNGNGVAPTSTPCDGLVCLPAVSANAPEQVRIVGTGRVRHDAQISAGLSAIDDGSIIETTVSTGTDQNSAIIAVPTVAANLGGFNNIELQVENVTLLTYPNPAIGCLNGYWASGMTVDHIRCWNGEQYYSLGTHTKPTNLAYGIVLPSEGNDTMTSISWTEISGFHTGVWASEHAFFNGVWAAYSLVGYEFGAGYYPITGHLGSQENGEAILFTGALTPGGTYASQSTEVQINLGLELDPNNTVGCSSWCYSTTDISDVQNSGLGVANGFIDYKTTIAGVGNTLSYPIRLSGATHLDFHDEYLHWYSYSAAGTNRAPLTAGTLPTVNADGLYVGQSIQYGAMDMVFGHDNQTGNNNGVMQCYSGGSGYVLGTTHGECRINPFGGNTAIGNTGGTAQVINSDLPNSSTAFQAVRIATCSTSTTQFSTCSVATITWPVAFPNTSYTVACSLVGANVSGTATGPFNITASTFSVGVINFTSGTAITSGTIDCIGKEDN